MESAIHARRLSMAVCTSASLDVTSTMLKYGEPSKRPMRSRLSALRSASRTMSGTFLTSVVAAYPRMNS